MDSDALCQLRVAVDDFVRIHKARPPRSCALGMALYNALRRRSYGGATRKIQEALGRKVQGLHPTQGRSVHKRLQLRKRTIRNDKTMPSRLKAFARNQRARNTEAALVCLVATARPPRTPNRGFDITTTALSQPWPNCEGLRLTPQPVVDFIYQALEDCNDALQSLCPGRWSLTWGSLLGAVRDRAMICWDFDADIFVAVDSPAEWEDALLPAFRHSLEACGRQVKYIPFVYQNGALPKGLSANGLSANTEWLKHKANLPGDNMGRIRHFGHVKVAPKHPHLPDGQRFQEFYNRLNEDARVQGSSKSRITLVKEAAAQMKKSTWPPGGVLGRNVLARLSLS